MIQSLRELMAGKLTGIEPEGAYVSQYKKENRKSISDKERIRKQTDAKHRLFCNARTSLSELLSGKSKSVKTLFLIGCELGFLYLRIESLRLPGMTWNNYGEWHVDHIVPCSAFDPSNASNVFQLAKPSTTMGPENLKDSPGIEQLG